MLESVTMTFSAEINYFCSLIFFQFFFSQILIFFLLSATIIFNVILHTVKVHGFSGGPSGPVLTLEQKF